LNKVHSCIDAKSIWNEKNGKINLERKKGRKINLERKKRQNQFGTKKTANKLNGNYAK